MELRHTQPHRDGASWQAINEQSGNGHDQVGRRLPASAHTSLPWRIHAVAPDFHIEDVWALPTPGGRDDFARLIDVFAAWDPGAAASRPVRALVALRWKLGELFGWDKPGTGLGTRVDSLRDRLPPDLREGTSPSFTSLPFDPLYLLPDEWAAEIANDTMHGVLHLGWVPAGDGSYHGQMAVLVKPNGRRGDLYMAAIKPFRHWLIYPAMLREIGHEWQVRTAAG